MIRRQVVFLYLNLVWIAMAVFLTVAFGLQGNYMNAGVSFGLALFFSFKFKEDKERMGQ